MTETSKKCLCEVSERMALNKAMHSEQFSDTGFVFDRYANTKQSTTNCRVMAALALIRLGKYYGKY